MATDLALPATAPAGRSPATLVARRTARKAVRSGALWGLVLGLYVASGALTYGSSYKTAAQRARLAELYGSNAGVSALVGPARDLQTVAGFTAWKYLVFVSLFGAVWGLLAGTRLLRGEEDAGRWELLLAGQTTRRRAAAQALVGLAAGGGALVIVIALILAAVGRSATVGIGAGPMTFFAIALTANAAVFLAGGALAGQLAATRRQAAAYAGAALGVCYALRLVADSGIGLGWLIWATPLGWVEKLQPLTSPSPLALVPVAALIVALAVLTVYLAGRRDLGAASLPDRASARPRTRLLFGPWGLSVRLARSGVVAWLVAIAAAALLIGAAAKSAASALTTSATIEHVLSRLGAPGAGAAVYLGVTFLLMAVLVAVIAAGQVGVMRAEEAQGRLEHLLVRPVSRSSWLASQVAVAGAAVLLSAIVAGLCTWLGAAGQHAGVSFASLLGAGLNVVPPAVCVLGIGVLALGVWPRAASAVTYGILAWSLLVEVVSGTLNLSHWLLDTSVFHEITAAPAVAPNWTSGAALLAVGALAAVVGGAAFAHRDVTGE